MEETIIPKTKEECFALLDKEVSEEDKQYLIEDEDASIDVHFSLGMWIRNNWIYPMSEDDLNKLMMQFEESEDPLGISFMCFHPDMVSDTIIEEYQKYLQNKNKKNK